jgi:hypothetical protein
MAMLRFLSRTASEGGRGLVGSVMLLEREGAGVPELGLKKVILFALRSASSLAFIILSVCFRSVFFTILAILLKLFDVPDG